MDETRREVQTCSSAENRRKETEGEGKIQNKPKKQIESEVGCGGVGGEGLTTL